MRSLGRSSSFWLALVTSHFLASPSQVAGHFFASPSQVASHFFASPSQVTKIVTRVRLESKSHDSNQHLCRSPTPPPWNVDDVTRAMSKGGGACECVPPFRTSCIRAWSGYSVDRGNSAHAPTSTGLSANAPPQVRGGGGGGQSRSIL